MKAITTKYFGATNSKGSRFKAFDSDHNSITVSYNHELNATENHREACRKLCEKLKWHGKLIGGYTKDGMVWVFTKTDDKLTVKQTT